MLSTDYRKETILRGPDKGVILCILPLQTQVLCNILYYCYDYIFRRFDKKKKECKVDHRYHLFRILYMLVLIFF